MAVQAPDTHPANVDPSSNFDETTGGTCSGEDEEAYWENPNREQCAGHDELDVQCTKQVVMDDMVGIIDKLPKLQQLCTKFRHYSMSIIIVSQSWRKIPSVIRNCLTALICFDLKNEKEFGKIHDEFTGSIPNSERLIKEIVNKRYDFFYFNIERQQLWHNFHTLKWSRDESEMPSIAKSPNGSPSPPPSPKMKRKGRKGKDVPIYPI